MMKVTICIGSSCHLKGSKQVIEKMQALVKEHNLKDKVTLAAKFCMGNCAAGVCVSIGEETYSVRPDNVVEFFKTEVLAKV